MYQENAQNGKYRKLSPLDIDSLTHIFQDAFDHFSRCKSSSEESYLKYINTISGCYTLTLIEKKSLFINDDNLNTFARCWKLKNSKEALEMLCPTLANMVNFIAEKAGLLDDPWFYHDFAVAIKKTLGNKITQLYGDIEESQRLQRLILQSRWTN
jgi:hypothetical protein